jgi:hypothetical protein
MNQNRVKGSAFTLAMLTLAGAAGLSLLTSSAAAYECKNTYTTVGANAVLKVVAQGQARTAWSATVKNQLGLSWSVWDIAASKTQPCSQAGGKWVCQAKAKPCNYVVP